MKENNQTADAVDFAQTIIGGELHAAIDELVPVITASIFENLILRLAKKGESRTIRLELSIPPYEDVADALASRYEGIGEDVKNGMKLPFAGGAELKIL